MLSAVLLPVYPVNLLLLASEESPGLMPVGLVIRIVCFMFVVRLPFSLKVCRDFRCRTGDW